MFYSVIVRELLYFVRCGPFGNNCARFSIKYEIIVFVLEVRKSANICEEIVDVIICRLMIFEKYKIIVYIYL